MAVLDEIQASIRQLSEGAGPSVVGIGQRWGVGSGVVLAEGRVLTNAHNVRGDQVTVTFADGRTAEGTVAGHDIDADLAVIDVDTGDAPVLPWADGTAPGVGTPVSTSMTARSASMSCPVTVPSAVCPSAKVTVT